MYHAIKHYLISTIYGMQTSLHNNIKNSSELRIGLTSDDRLFWETISYEKNTVYKNIENVRKYLQVILKVR